MARICVQRTCLVPFGWGIRLSCVDFYGGGSGTIDVGEVGSGRVSLVTIVARDGAGGLGWSYAERSVNKVKCMGWSCVGYKRGGRRKDEAQKKLFFLINRFSSFCRPPRTIHFNFPKDNQKERENDFFETLAN